MSQPALSVEEQYADGRYADFVEAKENAAFYKYYLHHSFLRATQPQLANPSLSRVLDLGCGNGCLTHLLLGKRSDLRVTAVDRIRAMLARATKRTQALRDAGLLKTNTPEAAVEFVCANALDFHPGTTDTKLKQDSATAIATTTTAAAADSEGSSSSSSSSLSPSGGFYGLVVSSLVLCHMHTCQELNAFFANVAKLLRPGGLTVHLVPPLDQARQTRLLADGRTTGSKAKEDEEKVHLRPRIAEPKIERVEIPMPGGGSGSGGKDDDDDAQLSNSSSASPAPPPPVVLYDTRWAAGDYIRAAGEAGLVNARVVTCAVSEEGVRALGEEFWAEIQLHLGQYAMVVAQKPPLEPTRAAVGTNRNERLTVRCAARIAWGCALLSAAITLLMGHR